MPFLKIAYYTYGYNSWKWVCAIEGGTPVSIGDSIALMILLILFMK